LLDRKGIAFRDNKSYNNYKELLSKMFELIPIDKDVFGNNCVGMIKNNNDTVDIINVFELPLI
jgi:predicted CoA-binding protein